MDENKDRPDQGIIKPGQTPPFPGHVAGDDFDGDKDAIADAAWKQSGGSIQAFEQLCREHASGQIDLLASPEDRERQQAEAAERGEMAPGSTEGRAGGLAPSQSFPGPQTGSGDGEAQH